MAEIFIRRGVFYCRVSVPASIRATLGGRAQLWKSLRTQSSDVAALQAALWDGRVSRLFFQLAQSAHTMIPAQIQALVAEYVNATLESVEEFSLTHTRTDDERQATGFAITDSLEESTGELLTNHFRRIAATADDLLAKHGLTVERDSLDWKQVYRGLLVGLQTALKTERRNAEGNFAPQPHNNNGKAEPRVVSKRLPMRPGTSLSLTVTLPMNNASKCLKLSCGGREGRRLRWRMSWSSLTRTLGCSITSNDWCRNRRRLSDE